MTNCALLVVWVGMCCAHAIAAYRSDGAMRRARSDAALAAFMASILLAETIGR